MGCIFVTLSGGEPLTTGNKIFSIAEIFKSRGLKILLTTNATLYENFSISDFKIFDSVQISLDGPQKIHEEIRGKGTFSTAIGMAKSLKRHLDVDVCFMMTLNQLNVDYIEVVDQLARKNGVRLAIERMTGATRSGSKNDLTTEQFFNALNLVDGKNIGCTDPCLFPFNKFPEEKTGNIQGGCTAGIAALALSTDLDIYPCARLRIKAGSLKESEFNDIWFNSEILNQLRDRDNLKGQCGKCEYIETCGGCRASAFARTGDFLAEDPICSNNYLRQVGS